MSASAIPPCPWSVTVPIRWATPMTRIPSSASTSPPARSIWTHSYPCNEKVGIKDYDGPFATPTVANGVVYTLSRKGDVFALNAKDGKVIWARNIVQEDGVRPPGFGGLAGSPLILGDKLILNGSSGGMALDARTGKTLWKSGTGAGGHATPVPLQIGQKTHLAIHSPRALTIVDAADGKAIWTTERRQPIGVNAPDPVVDGTKVFVTAGRGFGGALFDVTGATTPLWEQEGLSSHWHTSVLLNGFLFGPDGNNSEGAGRSPTSLRCLDWKTGEIKWTEPKLGFNGLIAVGGKLLVLTETGDLVLVRGVAGRLQRTWLGPRHRGKGLHRPGVRQREGVCAKHQRRRRVLGLPRQVTVGELPTFLKPRRTNSATVPPISSARTLHERRPTGRPVGRRARARTSRRAAGDGGP